MNMGLMTPQILFNQLFLIMRMMETWICLVANYPNIPLSQGNQFYHQKMIENDLGIVDIYIATMVMGNFEDVTEKAKLKRFGLTLGIVSSDIK